jgi:hypothetical protein
MGGHGLAQRYGYELRVPSLRFEKTGDEIRIAIDARINDLSKENATESEEVKKIAKDRNVDGDEVIAAGNDEELIGAYSTKAMNNAPRANALVRALEEDLAKMRRLAGGIAIRSITINELARVKKNIQSTRKFDLLFDEACLLGF